MNLCQPICALLLFLSLQAIYVAQWKIYPIVFSLFVCFVCLALVFAKPSGLWPPFHRTAWYGCCAYLLYVLAIFGVRGGDTVVLVKLIANVSFFLAACLFFLSMAR